MKIFLNLYFKLSLEKDVSRRVTLSSNYGNTSGNLLKVVAVIILTVFSALPAMTADTEEKEESGMIYLWTDSDGMLHSTSFPPPDGSSLVSSFPEGEYTSKPPEDKKSKSLSELVEEGLPYGAAEANQMKERLAGDINLKLARLDMLTDIYKDSEPEFKPKASGDIGEILEELLKDFGAADDVFPEEYDFWVNLVKGLTDAFKFLEAELEVSEKEKHLSRQSAEFSVKVIPNTRSNYEKAQRAAENYENIKRDLQLTIELIESAGEKGRRMGIAPGAFRDGGYFAVRDELKHLQE